MSDVTSIVHLADYARIGKAKRAGEIIGPLSEALPTGQIGKLN
jgi:hypothetical protein